MNRPRQKVEIASRIRQVRPTDRAGKQRVAHEKVVGGAIDPKQEANATEGMAGRVEHFERQAPDVDRLPMSKLVVGLSGLGQGWEAPPGCALLGQGLQEGVVRMEPPFDAPMLAHGRDVAGVIEMGVRVQQGHHRAVARVHRAGCARPVGSSTFPMVVPCDEPVRFVTGVDDHRVAGCGVADHRATHLERTDKEGLNHEVLRAHHAPWFRGWFIRRTEVVAFEELAPTSESRGSSPGLHWKCMAEQASAWTSAFDQGSFVRKSSEFRDHVSADGPFEPASERYHLYVSYACPWAHRTLLARALLGLEEAISVDVVDWRMQHDGSWIFNPDEPGATPDRVLGSASLEDVYNAAAPGWSASSRIGTVPVLWDRHHQTIVNNESREIVRMMTTSFAQAGLTNGRVLCPPDLREAIDAMIDANYEPVNNGVYKAGFARSQSAYDAAVDVLFGRLAELEAYLEGRDWLVGDGQGVLTEADVCLVPTLLRFDLVYVVHFKCSRARIADMPNLTAYLERFLALPGVAETVDWTHIKHHYFWSHQHMNPFRIVPEDPQRGIHVFSP